MENIWLFFLSVASYFGIWYGIKFCLWEWGGDGMLTISKSLKVLGIIVFLSMPFNINGHVFTVMGNAASEKDMYSVFSMYQKTQGTAFTLLTPFVWQEAERHAIVGIGIAGNQKAGQEAGVFIGIAGNQKAGQNAVVLFGIAGNQEAGQAAGVFIGIAGNQKAGQNATVGFGIAGNQKAEKSASVRLGVGFYQQVKEKQRTFGAFTALTAD